MDTTYDQFQHCGVKILTEVAGSDGWSSGFLYVTSSLSSFNYVFTTKHTLKTSYEDECAYIEDIAYLEIQRFEDGKFVRHEFIAKKELHDRIIFFEGDLVMVLTKKDHDFRFPLIQVSDFPKEQCFAWATTNASGERLLPLSLYSKSTTQRVYTIENWTESTLLQGSSGAGIISQTEPILYGFMMRHPTAELQGGFIDSVDVSFEEINNKLFNLKLELLSTVDSKKRRIVRDKLVVEINNAEINGVILDLDAARNRVIHDSYDDWHHDPLNYIDLSHEDFLFDYFQDFFSGKPYEVSEAEVFYLPKRSFTLRKAMVMSYGDRVYYSALVDVLGQRLNSALIPSVYSARYNPQKENALIISGVEQWKKMQYLIKDYSLRYNYIVEIDILNFYDNIDIEMLGRKILAVCETPNQRQAAKALTKVLIDFSHNGKNGIPQNNDASSLLATFYLNQVDTYMSNYCPSYIRFMDDIRIFCNDKYEARKYLILIEKELRRINLSLNSQKTSIVNLKPRLKKEKKEIEEAYRTFYDLEINKLSRFSNSRNHGLVNEAFHLAIRMLLENIGDASKLDKKSERKLSQAVKSIRKCVSRPVSLVNESEIIPFLEQAVELITERPWATPEICTMIAILDKSYIPDSFWEKASKLVLDDRFNIYPWQGYHLWLLFAKHKYNHKSLRQYASVCLDSNDGAAKPAIAGMMIYMGTIDTEYRRVLLRKYNNHFTQGNFQERIALIVLRAFETEDINIKDDRKKAIHRSLNYFKDKDLVFIPGEKEELDMDIEIAQMYSL